MPMYQQATALENAGFANKQTAAQGAIGALSSTAAQGFATANKQDAWNSMIKSLTGNSWQSGAVVDGVVRTADPTVNTPQLGGLGNSMSAAPDRTQLTGLNNSGGGNPLWNFGVSSQFTP